MHMKNILDFQHDIDSNNSRRWGPKIASFQVVGFIGMSGFIRHPQVMQECICLMDYMIGELDDIKNLPSSWVTELESLAESVLVEENIKINFQKSLWLVLFLVSVRLRGKQAHYEQKMISQELLSKQTVTIKLYFLSLSMDMFLLFRVSDCSAEEGGNCPPQWFSILGISQKWFELSYGFCQPFPALKWSFSLKWANVFVFLVKR